MADDKKVPNKDDYDYWFNESGQIELRIRFDSEQEKVCFLEAVFDGFREGPFQFGWAGPEEDFLDQTLIHCGFTQQAMDAWNMPEGMSDMIDFDELTPIQQQAVIDADNNEEDEMMGLPPLASQLPPKRVLH